MADSTLRLAIVFACVLATLGCDQLLGGNPPGEEGGAPTPGGGGTTTAADIAGIHGFGTVVENSDGLVSARLDVLTLGSEPHFLGGIASPTLTHAGATFPLLTGNSVGVFVTNSNLAEGLTYAPGDVYTFAFEVADEEGVLYSYSATATAPAGSPVIAEVAPVPIRFAGEPVELSLTNTAAAVSIRVSVGGAVTFDTTGVDDLSQVPLVLDAMRATATPVVELPGAAFSVPGEYRIEVTSLDISTPSSGGLSSGLGSASWFGAGTATTLPLPVE